MGNQKPTRSADDPWHLNAFAAWGQMKNYSGHTIRGYKHYLKRFIAWCELRSIEAPEEVTRKNMQRYQRDLFHHRKKDGKPYAFDTQLKHLVAIRTYFHFQVKNGYRNLNPAADIDLPKKGKTLPKVILTVAEIEALMEVPDIDTLYGIRDRAILEVFYSTGMRRSELVFLRIGDLDIENSTAFIRQGKGLKDRVVPLGDRALHWLSRYLFAVRPKLVRSKNAPDYVFLTQRGTHFRPETVSLMMQQWLEASSLEGIEGGCHLLRHAAATHMLEGGADIRFIQELLGHNSLESTQLYTRVSIRKLKEIHAQTHPGQALSECPPLEETTEQSGKATAFLKSLLSDGET